MHVAARELLWGRDITAELWKLRGWLGTEVGQQPSRQKEQPAETGGAWWSQVHSFIYLLIQWTITAHLLHPRYCGRPCWFKDTQDPQPRRLHHPDKWVPWPSQGLTLWSRPQSPVPWAPTVTHQEQAKKIESNPSNTFYKDKLNL